MNSQSEDQNSAQDERAELLAYREKVIELLRSREQKFNELEQERLKLVFLLGEASVQKLVRSGDASKIISGNAVRRSYAVELQKVESALADAQEELNKAKIRLGQVDDDLRQLNSLDGERA